MGTLTGDETRNGNAEVLSGESREGLASADSVSGTGRAAELCDRSAGLRGRLSWTGSVFSHSRELSFLAWVSFRDGSGGASDAWLTAFDGFSCEVTRGGEASELSAARLPSLAWHAQTHLASGDQYLP